MSDQLSKNKMIEVLEESLRQEDFDKFVVGYPYRMRKHPRPGSTFFTCNRISHVIDGSFDTMLGSGDKYEKQQLKKGTTLIMKPYCLTDSIRECRTALWGLVCLPDCLRLFHVDSMQSGALNTGDRYFYHISDTCRNCTIDAIATLCALEDDLTVAQFGKSLMILICTLALHDLKNSNVTEFGKAHNLWFQIRDYIALLPEQRHNRKEIAEHFKISETYVSRLFSRFSNSTFKEYLRREKLEQAKNMLATTQMTVDEVAYNAGFDNTSYFIKLFKAKNQITPGRWRRMNNGGKFGT
ncbi:MAG: helix-turn-helix transcriptional regulator [Oligosphaeraceae bacterium]|nr:helix-turn-helix transcriptional regulator [Oligosphaeraceae bacterium]